MTLKSAFIGFGKSANRYHLPYVLLRENIQVKTIFDLRINEAVAAPFRDKGVNFVTDLDELLNDEEIQLVTICTPPTTHYDLAKQSLEAGKNVIVEKPFTQTLAEAKELFALAAKKGLMIMPYQNRRFDGDFLALKQVVEQGYLGEPIEVESHFDNFRPDNTEHPGANSDGDFYGLGIHTMDRMISLFGRPDSVAYDIRNVQAENSVDDYFDVDLHYGRSFKVKVKTSHLVASSYPQFIFHGTKGSFIKYGPDQQENDLKAGIMPDAPGFGEDSPMYYAHVKYQNMNGDWIEKQIKTPAGDYGCVYDAAYETIVNGAPKLVSDEEALTNLEILENGFKNPSPSVYTL
jgi:predicted dehydrogenase